MKKLLTAYLLVLLCCAWAAAAPSTRKADGKVKASDVAVCFTALEEISLKAMKDDYDACREEAEATIARNKLAKQIQKEKKKDISDEKAQELALSAKYSERYLAARESVKDSDKSSYALKKISDPLRATDGYRPLTTSWFYLLVASFALSALVYAVTVPLRRRKGKDSRTAEQWGVAFTFWVIALAFSPALLKFYAELNPVAAYASCINDPSFWGYASMPAIQAGLFLILTRILASKTAAGRQGGGFLSGCIVCLVSALVSLAVLAGLNFLGLGIITTIAGNVVVWILKLIFYIFFILLTLIH